MTFKCKPNCGECCGPLGFDRDWLEKHKDKAQREIKEILEWKNGRVIALSNDESNPLACCFLKPDKTCAVYEDRPQLCREFGLSVRFPCAYVKPDGKPRTPGKTKQLQREMRHAVENDMRRIERRRGL